MKTFPIMRQPRYEIPHPTTIPWHVAELAYSVYRNRHGDGQTLQQLADRGGFGPGEMDLLLPDWRGRCLVTEDMVVLIHSKVIGFYHHINHDHVELKCDPKKTGNALSQMHQRIREGLEELFK